MKNREKIKTRKNTSSNNGNNQNKIPVEIESKQTSKQMTSEQAIEWTENRAQNKRQRSRTEFTKIIYCQVFAVWERNKTKFELNWKNKPQRQTAKQQHRDQPRSSPQTN